jgi:hypothetical protein
VPTSTSLRSFCRTRASLATRLNPYGRQQRRKTHRATEPVGDDRKVRVDSCFYYRGRHLGEQGVMRIGLFMLGHIHPFRIDGTVLRLRFSRAEERSIVRLAVRCSDPTTGATASNHDTSDRVAPVPHRAMAVPAATVLIRDRPSTPKTAAGRASSWRRAATSLPTATRIDSRHQGVPQVLPSARLSWSVHISCPTRSGPSRLICGSP